MFARDRFSKKLHIGDYVKFRESKDAPWQHGIVYDFDINEHGKVVVDATNINFWCWCHAGNVEFVARAEEGTMLDCNGDILHVGDKVNSTADQKDGILVTYQSVIVNFEHQDWGGLPRAHIEVIEKDLEGFLPSFQIELIKE